MKQETKKGMNRREFLSLSALGLAGLTILPSWAMNGVRIAPSDRVVLGFIGLGQQGLSDFAGFAGSPGVQVVACCDVDTMKTERFRRRVEAWRWYQETGNGYTADWGAHMFDIAQAAIGMDGSGPTEYIPQGYNGAPYATMKYANGIIMTEQPYLDDNDGAQGIKFWGTKGWIEVARGYLACSDASKVPAELAGRRPLSSAEQQRVWE